MPARDTEPASAKIARVEEVVNAIREDVAEIKASVKDFDHRVTYLADVRVTGLENREIRQQAIADERKRAADEARAAAEKAAAAAAQHASRRFSKRTIQIGYATVVVMLLGVIASVVALIASLPHH